MPLFSKCVPNTLSCGSGERYGLPEYEKNEREFNEENCVNECPINRPSEYGRPT